MPRNKPPLSHRLRLLQLLSEHDELTGAAALELEPAIPAGTVYTTLRRLERQKLVSSRQDTQKGLPGLPRRFYKITRRGRRYFSIGAELAKVIQSVA